MTAAIDLRSQASPQIFPLSVRDVFDTLTQSEQLYAHYMARSSWLGTRIILRQVSPESVYIFDFIMELYNSCIGSWDRLQESSGLSKVEMRSFLEYAAVFLQNIGNYYGHGDQKFTPKMSDYALEKLSLTSSFATELYQKFAVAITSSQPNTLGFSDQLSQTSYYIGADMSAKEVAMVSNAATERSIHLENTRILKQDDQGNRRYDVMQASVQEDTILDSILLEDGSVGRVIRGDHSRELANIHDTLSKAERNVANSNQHDYLTKLMSSLHNGDMELYKEALKAWVKDLHPSVETTIGFVEPYRDPYGIRAEFEGLVGILSKTETELLSKLVKHADYFVASLPWVGLLSENGGKGPFELLEMGYRDFTSVHVLAYCSTLVFPGINLPNYNDIRQQDGSKNIMMSNAIDGGSMSGDSGAEYILAHEKELFLAHRRQTYYLWVVFHELFGHGTGRFLEETRNGEFNFDVSNPPINPITGKPIESWYRRNQTWTGLFGDIATTVDECRAECIGAYLLSNRELTEMCGFTDETSITPAELEYNIYLQLGVAGLRSLENYSEEGRKWGQAHSRAHFAMFRTLLETCDDFMSIKADLQAGELTIHIDRSKIATHAKPAIGTLALKLHIYRCTADVEGCRKFYEALTTVEEPYSDWRRVVMAKKPPPRVFVQPNTFLDGDNVVLKEYPISVEGVIQSWAERNV